ncbi:hypothetical protein N9X88_00435 [Alphaproteobacteria bacterium]|nr:hypothetical protein [Alphaproteobacteria bacterium]
MKKFAILSIASLMTLSTAHAELHKGSVSFEYLDMSLDLSDSTTTLDGDVTQGGVGLSFFLNDNLELTLSSSTGDYTVLDTDIDIDTTEFGFIYHTSRVDLYEGEGSGFRLGFSSAETELSAGGISLDDTQNFVSAGYGAGLGNGLSVSAFATFQTDELSNNGFGLELKKCSVNNLCASVGAGSSTASEGDVESDGSGITIGIDVLF